MNGLLFAEIVIPFSRGALRVLYSKAMNGIARVNFAVVLLLLLAGAAAAAPPVVSKVEPPNWWPNHSINPIRILITGSGFANATVTAPAGFAISNQSGSANGHYLLFDLAIPSEAEPGEYPLRIRAGHAETEAPFHLDPPLPVGGRFAGFSPDDVIYLVMVDRFADGDPSNDLAPHDRTQPHQYHGGDFQGIIDHLPYLKSLGVTAIWMTPIYDNSNRLIHGMSDYHGYGTIDYYGVEDHFGTMQKLRELVDKAHALGLKIIQDQVANHVGPQHPWVDDPPKPTWFHGSKENHINEAWQLWMLPDPHAAPELKRAVLDGWFANVLPDMDQEDPDVARYEIQNTLWWLGQAGFDGIRQDTLPYVPLEFWRPWSTALRRQYPNVRVVGEVFEGDPAIPSFFQGKAVDTVFDFPDFFAVRDAFAKGGSMEKLSQVQAKDRLYPDPMGLVTFLGNHDVVRFMSEPGATIAKMKLAFAFLLTTRGIPEIYYGDEVGMKGGADPDNRRDFPGGWPGDAQNAFTDRTAAQAEIFDYVKRLLQVRAANPVLRRGELTDLGVTRTTWVYSRRLGTSTAIVAFNNGTEPASIEANPGNGAEFEPQLQTGAPLRVSSGKLLIHLPAQSAEIYLGK